MSGKFSEKCIVISIVHAFHIVESYFSLFLNIRGTYLHDTNRNDEMMIQDLYQTKVHILFSNPK